MAYLTKSEAFALIRSRYPRGADVGTKVYYPDNSTQQRVEFTVAAEQVWRTDTDERVMGLIWSGVCATCREGFFQPSPTHPPELNEHCAFCCSQRYDTYNESDIKLFNPRVVSRGSVKRRGRVEGIILESLQSFKVDVGVDPEGNIMRRLPPEGVPVHDLEEKVLEALPPPEAGRRDTRRQTVVRAIQSLTREKDAIIALKGHMLFFANYTT